MVNGQEESPQECTVAQHQLCLCTEMQMCIVVVGYGGRVKLEEADAVI